MRIRPTTCGKQGEGAAVRCAINCWSVSCVIAKVRAHCID